MTLTDTHTHIYLDDFKEDIDEVIQRAKEKGVTRIFLPNIDVGSISQVKSLVEGYTEICHPMMGLHPCSVKEDYQEQLTVIEKELRAGNYCAVGEIGIDLYWDKTFFKQQEEAFRIQINWAKELELPIIIHCRDSFDEIIKVLEEENDDGLRGIFHCFTGSIEQAHRVLALKNFFLGIGGVVTFKNAGLDKTVRQLKVENIVLETDAPYLTPAPHRGKRNESSYIYHIAGKVAELLNTSMETVASVTTKNSEEIFRC